MENVTKLRRTKNTIEQEKSEKVIEKFIEACINVNASIFEPFIEEDQLFEDVDKYRFLQLMKDQFDHCLGYGMEKLTLRKGVCKGCQNGKKTYEFYHEDYMAFSYVIRS